ncbi:hypothetical protein LUCX_15 [Xanthomonas phage vB_XciM_LucasX]|nr:hypothetical protein LUCX_15 [Xanthomonas phage vB_XciM_LucasX]
MYYLATVLVRGSLDQLIKTAIPPQIELPYVVKKQGDDTLEVLVWGTSPEDIKARWADKGLIVHVTAPFDYIEYTSQQVLPAWFDLSQWTQIQEQTVNNITYYRINQDVRSAI